VELKNEKYGQAGSLIITVVGLVLSLASALTAAFSGFGSRWGFWHFTVGFEILSFAVLGGIASSTISVVGVIAGLRKGLWKRITLSMISLAIGLITFGVPLSWYLAAKHLPKIHDITTDTKNPPLFMALLALRKNAPNPPEYGGKEVALKQHEAYPDIKPLFLRIPPDRAFDRALSVCRRMGWDIVSANKGELRIEATDTTFWFGFKDDIVVRITPVDEGSRIDVRSLSRVGLSDVGTNDRRILKFLRELAKPG
jgi:uncharacterized protein (DUF1499 family)